MNARPAAQPDPRSDRWLRLGTLPVVAAVLVAINGLYLAFVAFGNVTDFGTNQPFVHHVLEMDTTNFGAGEGVGLDPDVMWRAVTAPWLQDLAYLGLIGWELAAAVILVAAAVTWVRERGTSFPVARALSTIGLLMVVVLFMGGFTAVGGEWFQMWKSTDWNGLDPAFRNTVLAVMTLLLIHLPSPYWQRSGS